MASRGELEPREGIHRHGIGIDARGVTEDDIPIGVAEQRANACTEPRKVGARYRAANGKRDDVWPWAGHVGDGPGGRPKLIATLD